MSKPVHTHKTRFNPDRRVIFNTRRYWAELKKDALKGVEYFWSKRPFTFRPTAGYLDFRNRNATH